MSAGQRDSHARFLDGALFAKRASSTYCAAGAGTLGIIAATGIFVHVARACRAPYWIARPGAEG